MHSGPACLLGSTWEGSYGVPKTWASGVTTWCGFIPHSHQSSKECRTEPLAGWVLSQRSDQRPQVPPVLYLACAGSPLSPNLIQRGGVPFLPTGWGLRGSIWKCWEWLGKTAPRAMATQFWEGPGPCCAERWCSVWAGVHPPLFCPAEGQVAVRHAQGGWRGHRGHPAPPWLGFVPGPLPGHQARP